MRMSFSLAACLIVLWSALICAAEPPQAPFEINPKEIDLGILRPGKPVHATAIVSKSGGGELDWQLEDPPGCRKLSLTGAYGAS